MAFNQQIGPAATNLYTDVTDFEAVWLLDAKSRLPKLVSEGMLVDLLREPGAQLIGHAIGTANDSGT